MTLFSQPLKLPLALVSRHMSMMVPFWPGAHGKWLRPPSCSLLRGTALGCLPKPMDVNGWSPGGESPAAAAAAACFPVVMGTS